MLAYLRQLGAVVRGNGVQVTAELEFIDDIHPAPPPEKPVDLSDIVPLENRLAPGVYFNLDEDTYHSAFGLSYSGIKDFRTSPLTWWAKSPLNPRQAEVLEEITPTDAKELGKAFDARIICGKAYFDAHFVSEISLADYPGALKTMDDLKGWLEERGLKKTGKTKQELIDRALEADSTVKIWDAILDGYRKQHEGKTFLDPKWFGKIEMAAALIEGHPYLAKALTGGAPQVSVVWNCPDTGIPCRSRFDYLKARVIVDLKTLLPRDNMPLDNCIGREIGHRKYYVQAAFYAQAAAQIPRFIKSGQVYGDAPTGLLDALVKHPDKEWLWLFQLKGPAPVARGVSLPKTSNLWRLGEMEIDNAKHAFRACLEKYGALPWVDPEPIQSLDDANVPAWALI